MSLPVINIEPLVTRSSGVGEVATQIRSACTGTGFFYISGHGVTPELQHALEEQARLFFAREAHRKMEVAMALGGKAWRGYFNVGDELTSGKPDLKEGYYFGEELTASDPRVQAGLPMHGPNLFPADMPALKNTVLDYISAMTQLGHALMEGMSLSLGLPATYFHDTYTQSPTTLFRIFHYPPPMPANVPQWGVGEHTDYGVLTLLKQDDAGGLQVKGSAGWIDAPPIPNTFVCNIGDMLDRITGGFYRSTPHRVLNRSGKSRFSYPFFFDPGFDSLIKPLQLSEIEYPADDRADRWDKMNVHAFEGTYGAYLINKVGRVFPELRDAID